MAMATAERYVGGGVLRKEDATLLTGEGTFVESITPPGTLHVAFVRSPYGAATIGSIDATAARSGWPGGLSRGSPVGPQRCPTVLRLCKPGACVGDLLGVARQARAAVATTTAHLSTSGRHCQPRTRGCSAKYACGVGGLRHKYPGYDSVATRVSRFPPAA